MPAREILRRTFAPRRLPACLVAAMVALALVFERSLFGGADLLTKLPLAGLLAALVGAEVVRGRRCRDEGS